ncbi:kinase-like protein, partial [Auricularia subglabra TFB-10046 SS5]
FQRLRREIRVWQQLDHPNVLPLYGVHFGMSGDFPSLVAPWCENGDICTYLASRADDPDLFNIKLELVRSPCGVALHSYNPEIVHGDLKGANILVSKSHQAQLCDFGYASMKVDKGESLFQSSAAKGTWRWMAPELLSDDNPRHTKASDVWAYGCLLVEVLSGKVPYHEKVNDVPVIIAIARGEHPSRPADTDDNMWELMLSCWALDASDRPPAEFIVQRLDHIRSEMD